MWYNVFGDVMSLKLFIEAIIKYLLGVVLIGLLVFLPAGTLDYLNGWIFMAILFVPMFIAGIIMMIKNPNLLASRLEAKEKQAEQSLVVKLSGLMFLAGFILAGLDYRYKWLQVPQWLNYTGIVLFILSYALYAEVLRENAYLSRTISVATGQKVIDKGLYGIVRHPMYTATIFLFISMPLVLGSFISFFIFLIYPFLIAYRAVNEEKFLVKELEGYDKYLLKVKYRFIPFIW